MGLLRVLVLCLCVAPTAPALAQAPAAPTPIPSTPLSLINRAEQWNLEQISANHFRLTGQVELESGPQTKFFADQIEILMDPDLRLIATGNVVFRSTDGQIAAERVEFNVNSGTGTFHQASGILSLGPTANRAEFGNQDPDVYFYGNRIDKLGPQSYRITKGGFTTCVQPTPRWEVVSDSVMLNMNEYAIARNMLLRVKGVPLMYLPVIYYPIQDDDRATGFLMPTYGASSLRGQTLSNAFFWALGRSHDATFYHDWFTTAGQGAGAEYRYAAGQGSFGNFRYYQFSQQQSEFTQGGRTTVLPAQNSFQIVGSGNQQVGTAIRITQSVNYASSLVTRQLYQQNISQASSATRSISAGVSGVWGAITASGQYSRVESFANAQDSQVYGSTPRGTFALAPTRLLGLPVYASLNGDAALSPAISRRNGVTLTDRSLGRFDFQPSMRAALSRLTFLSVNTNVSYRTTHYTRSNGTDDPFTRSFVSGRTEVIGPVLTKIWETPDSSFSERMKHVIEPVFSLDYVSDIDNVQQTPILTDTADLIFGDTARFTYGVNNRLLFRARTLDGSPGQTVEFMNVEVKQTYYATDASSRNDTTYVSGSSRPVDLSAIALIVRATTGPRFNSTNRFEYDVHGDGLKIATTGVTANLGPATSQSSVTGSFTRSRPTRTSKPTTSLSGSTSLRFVQNRVATSYSISWDIGGAGILSQGGSVMYLAQCCGIQAEFQKFKYPVANPNFPIASDRRFNVSFVLAGLGTFSNFFGAFGAGQ